MLLEVLQCPNCGGSLDIAPGSNWTGCSYCGTKISVTTRYADCPLVGLESAGHYTELVARDVACQLINKDTEALQRKYARIDRELRIGIKMQELKRESIKCLPPVAMNHTLLLVFTVLLLLGLSCMISPLRSLAHGTAPASLAGLGAGSLTAVSMSLVLCAMARNHKRRSLEEQLRRQEAIRQIDEEIEKLTSYYAPQLEEIAQKLEENKKQATRLRDEMEALVRPL